MIEELISEYKNLFGNKKMILLRSLLCYYRTPNYRVVVLIRCLLKQKSTFMRKLYRKKLVVKYGVEIGIKPQIGKNLRIKHFQGIVIGNDVILGDNCILYQQVTLGQKNNSYPKIGNNVTVFAGAKVLGNITVGDNCVIGANAVVLKNIPSDKCAVGVPCKITDKRILIYE
ncbi:serine O-acetyltransferase [Clostridium botulinum]|uniref:serine O-acetyltransferase n=1 Tax=Clostridium botulinum TaxID=1491 RepID=UPI001C9BBB12|nr:serine acetyltransferase [Clostridium botulinum]MBY6811420.1 serine acetyltransferase [Clostridium botulinum]MBY6824829.1 serine acetyltransferase [Clostridium botulinum]MBY6835233.1 serine acetyltransferase [Clostridium botulinum]MBY6973746.1 serine acetyltransferase [Clostridium botulinum]HBJ1651639.1 serine acetyltransferase [Clostridium botulinum]